jgi:hypothetical protein
MFISYMNISVVNSGHLTKAFAALSEELLHMYRGYHLMASAVMAGMSSYVDGQQNIQLHQNQYILQ